MTTLVDGFGLKFTGRTTWKAERSEFGSVIDIVPVTWTKGMNREAKTLEVWFRNPVELQAHRISREPFIVAVAIAKDYDVSPHEYKEFRGVYQVVATGNMGCYNDGMAIETTMLRRIFGKRTGVKNIVI